MHGAALRPPKVLQCIKNNPDLMTLSLDFPDAFILPRHVVSLSWFGRSLEISIRSREKTIKGVLDFMRMYTSAKKITKNSSQMFNSKDVQAHYDSPPILLQNLAILNVKLGQETCHALQYLKLPPSDISTHEWMAGPFDLSIISNFVQYSSPNLLELRICKLNKCSADILSFLSQTQVSRLPVVTILLLHYEDFIRATTSADIRIDAPHVLSRLKYFSRSGVVGWAKGDVVERLIQDFADEGITSSRLVTIKPVQLLIKFIITSLDRHR